ncbi:MAG: transcriptional repressor [Lachnospiraceae bacterium]|nr:transcriptional repressor [Lachnospiraceae bacterium]
MKSTYQTQQRKILLDFLAASHDRQFTIEEIMEGLYEEGRSVPQSSVYRLMKKLVEEGVVRRHSKEDSRQFVYQIIESEECHSHLHLQCTACGKLVHLSHEATKEAKQWMQGTTGFELDQEKTFLYGTCTDCKSNRI